MHDHHRGTLREGHMERRQTMKRSGGGKGETKVWLGDRGLSSRVIGALVRMGVREGGRKDRFPLRGREKGPRLIRMRSMPGLVSQRLFIFLIETCLKSGGGGADTAASSTRTVFRERHGMTTAARLNQTSKMLSEHKITGLFLTIPWTENCLDRFRGTVKPLPHPEDYICRVMTCNWREERWGGRDKRNILTQVVHSWTSYPGRFLSSLWRSAWKSERAEQTC